METLTLIGMPASGKSTAGKRAAELLGCPFLDGDDLIERRTGEPLSSILSRLGAEGFLALEEEVLCTVSARPAVIATGGSAIYSKRAMAHLKSLGRLVYLKIAEGEAEARIPDFTARGVVMRENVSTLRELYAERVPLYEKYADVTVECTGKTPEEIAEELIKL